jgi:N6-L-threonylcarbamoyladenine synthase
MKGYDYSFSGLKTSFLYTIRDRMKDNKSFIEENTNDLCASLQYTIIEVLMEKVRKAAFDLNISDVAVAGGVSANSGLRNAFLEHAKKYRWNVFIPKFSFTTDNAAMIAITGYYKFLNHQFADISLPPFSKTTIE